MEDILRLFPKKERFIISKNIGSRWSSLQEIRVRLYKPLEFVFDNRVEWLEEIKPKEEFKAFMLGQLSEYSLYRMEDELREGYMTIEGGHRVGLAGKVNTLHGAVKAIQNITFLNIRIAKERIGIASQLIPYIYDQRYLNTLLIGPPLTGKTTLLRDLTRILASGWKNIPPYKVGVVDERSEIGAAKNGIPQHNIGLRTDVLDACPKVEGMMMLIRSMSPDIIIVDEIGSSQDVQALMEAIHSGVAVICTIHGQSLEELKNRPSLKEMFHEKIFKRYIVLEKNVVPGKIQTILNEDGIKIYEEREEMKNEVDWRTSFHQSYNLDRI